MCLLTFINEYTDVDIDSLATGAENNPDGFGYAIHTGRDVVHNSGLNFERILDEFVNLRKTHHGPALFHSRITTHGGTTVDNCHPFQVGRDSQTVMAHNGMLPIDAKNGKSDTRIFAEELFPSWGGSATLNSRKMRKRLSKFASGSKLVFLSANPDVNENYIIINEKDGTWDKGVWWSNSSYKWTRNYTYGGGSMYTTGWERREQLYVPVSSDMNQRVVDCTYIDEKGDEVWGELWTCGVCGVTEYFDEDNINEADLCAYCDACWFCANPRLYCDCYFAEELNTPDDDHRAMVHTVGNYDSLNDVW